MDFYKFYVFQRVIDDFRNSRKRVPKQLKDVIYTPNVSNFFIFKKLNLTELIQFHEVLNLKINKKMIIECLECLKYNTIGIEKKFNLPVTYLQKISDFIEDHKNLINDFEYKSDLEYLQTFY